MPLKELIIPFTDTTCWSIDFLCVHRKIKESLIDFRAFSKLRSSLSCYRTPICICLRKFFFSFVISFFSPSTIMFIAALVIFISPTHNTQSNIITNIKRIRTTWEINLSTPRAGKTRNCRCEFVP